MRPFFCPWVHAVCSCLHTFGCEAYAHLRQMDTGSITGAHIWMRAVHMKGGGGGVRHKQVCTRVDSERQKNCSSPCPARGSNPGSSDLDSDSLTTELCPLSTKGRVHGYRGEIVELVCGTVHERKQYPLVANAQTGLKLNTRAIFRGTFEITC